MYAGRVPYDRVDEGKGYNAVVVGNSSEVDLDGLSDCQGRIDVDNSVLTEVGRSCDSAKSCDQADH